MNYNHINEVNDHWEQNINAYLHNRFNVSSFSEYIKCISNLKTFNWVKDVDSFKMIVANTPVDIKKFVTQYEDKCITYYKPPKPEEGYFRIIYQISPTLHIETPCWIWSENDEVHSYLMFVSLYKHREEYDEFMSEIKKIRKEGDTNKKNHAGFVPFQK